MRNLNRKSQCLRIKSCSKDGLRQELFGCRRLGQRFGLVHSNSLGAELHGGCTVGGGGIIVPFQKVEEATGVACRAALCYHPRETRNDGGRFVAFCILLFGPLKCEFCEQKE